MIADTFSKEVHIYKVGDHESSLHPIIIVEPRREDAKESTPISLYIRQWSTNPKNLHFNVLTKVKNDIAKKINTVHEMDVIEEVSRG
jgi:hypothetical protein